jgi:hypothetical protein
MRVGVGSMRSSIGFAQYLFKIRPHHFLNQSYRLCLVGRFEILGKDVRELLDVLSLPIDTPGHDRECHATLFFGQEVALCSDVQVFENGRGNVARGIRVRLEGLNHLGGGDDLRVRAPRIVVGRRRDQRIPATPQKRSTNFNLSIDPSRKKKRRTRALPHVPASPLAARSC